MANIYSTEYQAVAIDLPRGTVNGNLWDAKKRFQTFSLTVPAAPVAADIYHIALLPPKAYVLMPEFFVQWPASSNNPTMDVGWLAYTDTSGAAVVADQNGLDAAIAMGTVVGEKFGGMLILAASVIREAPAVFTRDFDNREEVTLTLVFSQALDAAETLSGYVTYSVTG